MSPEIIPNDDQEAKWLGAGMCVVGSPTKGFKVLREIGERHIDVKGSTMREAYFNAAIGLLYEDDLDALFRRHPVEPKREPKSGFVYFIAGEVGLVKIGFAAKPEQRLRDLQCGSPIELRILATVAGMPALERDYHKRFADYRKHREWFERCPEIEAEIERLACPNTVGKDS